MQTKSSYRALKWTLFMGLAASLASACVVTTGDGDDDDVSIDGGDGGTGNTGNKSGAGGKSGSGTGGTTSGSSAGGTGGSTAGTGTGGTGGGAADPDYPGACDSELKTPTIEGSCAENAADNDCGACLKSKCCDSFGACYGKAPTSACGYGPSPSDDLGQFDKMLECYDAKNDGIASIAEILTECEEESFNQCGATDDFLNEDTNDLLICAQNGADEEPGTSDDCLDVCFPPAE